MDNNELLGKMIEYQIDTFKDSRELQESFDDLQEAYRTQCVANAHLVERLKGITDFVKYERYCTREDLMAILHIEEEQDKVTDDFTADDLPFGQKDGRGDALEILSKEMEEMAK